MIALFLEDLLTDMGCEVIGPATSVVDACAMASESDIDAAIVDVDLHGAMSWGVASALKRRDVPFMFSTGYDGATIVPACFAGVPVIAKPFAAAKLRHQLGALIAGG